MKKTLYIYTTAASLLFAACSSSKKTASATPVQSNNSGNTSVKQAKDKLPTYKRVEFDRYYFDGVKEKLTGNFQRAAQNFEDATHVDPTSSAAFYELGNAYLHLNRVTDAEVATQTAAKLDDQNKWYFLQLGDIYRYEKKWPETGNIYEKLIALNPDEIDYYFNLAETQIMQNKGSDAIKTYDRIEKHFGKSEEVSLRRYNLYLEMGKADKAMSELNNLIALNPTETKYYQLQAEVYLKSGQEDKAMEVYQKLLKTDPNNGEVQLAMAEFYNHKGDKAAAQEQLKKAFANKSLGIDSKIAILYNNYLMPDKLSAETKQQGEDLAALLVQAHPNDAKSHAIYGDFLYQDKKLKDALNEYRRSRDIKNNVFAVWQQIFFIESELSDNKGLETESSKALELFPNQPLVYFFNGRAKIETKDYKGAVDVLESGRGQVVDNPNLESEFYVNLAEAYYRMKNYKESDASFEKVLAINPENATALNNYAYYLSERNDRLDKAEAMSKKSLDKEPDNSSFLDTYGWILYQRGKYQDAADYIKKSLDKEPSAAEVNEHYGDVLYKLGRTDEALDYWKKAKSLGSEAPGLEKKISEKRLHE